MDRFGARAVFVNGFFVALAGRGTAVADGVAGAIEKA